MAPSTDPTGWVVEDIDNTNITSRTTEEQSGFAYLATICPQVDAVPLIGGYKCEEGSTLKAHIMRFDNLTERPEFASLGFRSITTSDLLSYYLQFWQKNIAGFSNIQIWNNTDTIVDSVRAQQTDQIAGRLPARL